MPKDYALADDPAALFRLSRRIKSRRAHWEYTQERLARAAGVSRATITRIERGETVNPLSLVKVCRALGAQVILRWPDEDDPDLIPPEPSDGGTARDDDAVGGAGP